ncbi:MAG: hypothetical protein ABTQ31_14135 [Rhizobiaceae bacterium]
MFRTSDIVLIGVMVAAAAYTYKVKHEAEDRLTAIRKIETQIKLEEDSITLLRADWSLLTQPGRLQRLATYYQSDLQLQPTDPHQFVRLKDIPERQLSVDDLLKQGGSAAAGADPVVTGSVSR